MYFAVHSLVKDLFNVDTCTWWFLVQITRAPAHSPIRLSEKMSSLSLNFIPPRSLLCSMFHVPWRHWLLLTADSFVHTYVVQTLDNHECESSVMSHVRHSSLFITPSNLFIMACGMRTCLLRSARALVFDLRRSTFASNTTCTTAQHATLRVDVIESNKIKVIPFGKPFQQYERVHQQHQHVSSYETY